MDLNQFMVALLRADETGSSSQHHQLKDCGRSSSTGVAEACDDVSDREELHTAFHVFDANSDGFIDASELRLTMHELTGDTLTDDDVDAMIRSADRDGDGRINYNGMFWFILGQRADRTSVRSPVVEKKRLRPGHWLWSVLWVSFTCRPGDDVMPPAV